MNKKKTYADMHVFIRAEMKCEKVLNYQVLSQKEKYRSWVRRKSQDVKEKDL